MALTREDKETLETIMKKHMEEAVEAALSKRMEEAMETALSKVWENRLAALEEQLHHLETRMDQELLPLLKRCEVHHLERKQEYRDFSEKLKHAATDIEILRRASAEQRRKIPHIM